jgi:hypothetical protein
MKMVIAGSRTILDYATVDKCIQLTGMAESITEVVSGTAKGPDRLGEQWAKNRGISIKQFPADWNKDGRAAGYMRNLDMANYADGLIAIWDGVSKGTAHMIHAMKSRNKPVWVCEVNPEVDRHQSGRTQS